MTQSVINLEQGMPTVQTAHQKLDQALQTAKVRRVTVLKVIHGYGSSGRGGAIKRDVQLFLADKKRGGTIREFVPGERFSPFDAAARAMLAVCPGLAKDHDYSRGNDGITIVLL